MNELLRGLSIQSEWLSTLSRIETSLAAKHRFSGFVQAFGLKKGVTGYSLHVVPVAIYAWLRHPGDFRAAMVSALNCGGDTDTVGAILGALVGATVGQTGIPREWLDDIWDWPRSVLFMQRVARRLDEQTQVTTFLGPVRYFWPGQLKRNLLFSASSSPTAFGGWHRRIELASPITVTADAAILFFPRESKTERLTKERLCRVLSL